MCSRIVLLIFFQCLLQASIQNPPEPVPPQRAPNAISTFTRGETPYNQVRWAQPPLTALYPHYSDVASYPVRTPYTTTLTEPGAVESAAQFHYPSQASVGVAPKTPQSTGIASSVGYAKEAGPTPVAGYPTGTGIPSSAGYAGDVGVSPAAAYGTGTGFQSFAGFPGYRTGPRIPPVAGYATGGAISQSGHSLETGNSVGYAFEAESAQDPDVNAGYATGTGVGSSAAYAAGAKYPTGAETGVGPASGYYFNSNDVSH